MVSSLSLAILPHPATDALYFSPFPCGSSIFPILDESVPLTRSAPSPYSDVEQDSQELVSGV